MDPITRSTNGFCQGDRGAVRTSSMSSAFMRDGTRLRARRRGHEGGLDDDERMTPATPAASESSGPKEAIGWWNRLTSCGAVQHGELMAQGCEGIYLTRLDLECPSAS